MSEEQEPPKPEFVLPFYAVPAWYWQDVCSGKLASQKEGTKPVQCTYCMKQINSEDGQIDFVCMKDPKANHESVKTLNAQLGLPYVCHCPGFPQGFKARTRNFQSPLIDPKMEATIRDTPGQIRDNGDGTFSGSA